MRHYFARCRQLRARPRKMLPVHSYEVEALLNLPDEEDPPCTIYHAVRVTDRRLISAVLRWLNAPTTSTVAELPAYLERLRHDEMDGSSTILIMPGQDGDDQCKPGNNKEWDMLFGALVAACLGDDDDDDRRSTLTKTSVKVPSVAPLTRRQAEVWSARLWKVRCRAGGCGLTTPSWWTAPEREYVIKSMRKVVDKALSSNGNNTGEAVTACLLVHPRRLGGPEIEDGIHPSSDDDLDTTSVSISTNRPLGHAVMNAIDAVGRLNCDRKRVGRSAKREGDQEEDYLCTGYDAFLTHEPCAMCAMALLHSRVSRVFWHVPDARRGALGSRVRLHTLKSVNHRYEVYRSFPSEEVLFGEEKKEEGAANALKRLEATTVGCVASSSWSRDL